ncbi:hypothetical protein, partial [Enterobacter kobei]|uniref:hypothetical protein n=1 Tax=Enterobacter kobei TaxID=208224 RepID=UPI002004CD15
RKPQRKRATKGSECERVSAAGFSLTLFMDQDGAASVTAKVNTAECRGRRCREKPVHRLSSAAATGGQ